MFAHGFFSVQRDMAEFHRLVLSFFSYIMEAYGFSSLGQLFARVRSFRIPDTQHFEMAEETVLAALDRWMGLSVARERVIGCPDRMSTVLHWRVLERLLREVPKAPSVLRQVTVKSTSSPSISSSEATSLRL